MAFNKHVDLINTLLAYGFLALIVFMGTTNLALFYSINAKNKQDITTYQFKRE